VLRFIVEGTDPDSSKSLPKLAQPWRQWGLDERSQPTYHVDLRAAELIRGEDGCLVTG
jgi:hypothetical protein